MQKDTFDINHESLMKLNIDPKEAVMYLENKLTTTINPVHVKALHLLKQKPPVPTS